MNKCLSQKKSYQREDLAIEALIEAHTHFNFSPNQGPISVYKCDDCGEFHLTSKGVMNEKLASYIKDGSLKRMKEANDWNNKLKRYR